MALVRARELTTQPILRMRIDELLNHKTLEFEDFCQLYERPERAGMKKRCRKHRFFRFFVKFWGAKVSMHSWRGHALKIVRVLFRCVC